MHEIPSSLEEMQHWFAHLVTSPILQSDEDQIPLFPPDVVPEIRKKIASSPTLKPEERLGIYRQQYWWRLIGVMQDLFPSLVALLGHEEFNSLIAEPYLSSHIPKDWFISNIGSDLPKWLETSKIKKELLEGIAKLPAPEKSMILSQFAGVAERPELRRQMAQKGDFAGAGSFAIPSLLGDFAKLDLAYEHLLFADILPTIDLSQCEKETLYLQPFVLLFELDADLFSFRDQLLQEQKPSLESLKKWGEKRCLVLYRLNEKNYYEEIHPVFFKLLSRFQKGAKLKEMIPLLEKCDDVAFVFQTMASRGWVTLSSPRASDRSMQLLVQIQRRSMRQREN